MYNKTGYRFVLIDDTTQLHIYDCKESKIVETEPLVNGHRLDALVRGMNEAEKQYNKIPVPRC